MFYYVYMLDKQPEVFNYHVRDLDAGTIEDIRQLAALHRVSAATVIEEAMWWFGCELGKSIPLPDGWTRPRREPWVKSDS